MTAERSDPPPRPVPVRDRRVALHAALAFALGFLPITLVAITAGRPVESDAYFHLAIARDYVERPFDYRSQIHDGVLAEVQADREPLFHIVLAGFLAAGCSPELTAALTSGVVSGALALVLFLHSRSLLAVLIGVFATNTFLYRLLMCRPHGFALVLVCAGVALLMRRRYRSAAAVNFVYGLSYSVPVLLVAAAGLQAITSRKLRGLAWVTAASGAALLCHPHFPDNVTVLWFQGYQVMANVLRGNPGGIELPTELLPWHTADFLIDGWLPLAVFAIAMVRRDVPGWFRIFLALLLVLTLRSVRFIEYWAPLVALASVPALRSIVPRESNALRWACLAVFLLARPAVGVIALGTQALEATQQSLPYEAAATWLREHGEGHPVFNAEWFAYGQLRYFGGNFAIFEGSDPVFLRTSDPDQFYDAAVARRGDMGPDEFRAVLGYPWILVTKKTPLDRRMRRERVPVRFEDDKVAVFELGSSPWDLGLRE